jgi:GH15 family glucan-1,4-alpha-glucosidase
VGGARNWDYRFTWLRDGAWSAHALGLLGHHEEEARFRDWASDIIGAHGLPLRVLYTISGTSDTLERELPHLDGYRDSRPVRIGNGARDQHQLDTYGELVEFILKDEGRPDAVRWERVRLVVDWVLENWRAPDSGIWEMRSEPRHFVLSKAMAWVGLARAAETARKHGLPGDVERWEREARLVREEVLTRGYDARRGSFLQAYDYPHLDASNLLLPLIGFIDAKDPRMVATVDATMRELTSKGLVYRYLDAGDGVPGGEATFAYCTFWLVEVLALQGRVEQARAIFDSMIERATPLGLFAEEIDAGNGEHLGNFPQAFPHIGLIHAALALRRATTPASGEAAERAPTPA